MICFVGGICLVAVNVEIQAQKALNETLPTQSF